MQSLLQLFTQNKDFELEAVFPCKSLFPDAANQEAVCSAFTKLMHKYLRDDEIPSFQYLLDVYYNNIKNPMEKPMRARYTMYSKDPQICQKIPLSRLYATTGNKIVSPDKQVAKKRKRSISGQSEPKSLPLCEIQFSKKSPPSAKQQSYSVNLKQEKKMNKNPLVEHPVWWTQSLVRLQQRWSFKIQNKNFQIDFTKISEGKTKEEACKTTPHFSVEIECLRSQENMSSMEDEFKKCIQTLLKHVDEINSS